MHNRFWKNHFLATLLTTSLVLLLSSCTTIFFQPLKKMVRTPDQINIDYQQISFSAADKTQLSAWLLKTPAGIKKNGVIYFLHGNAENISTHIASVYWLPEHGWDVFMLDYRGFGRSAGTPDLPAVFDDIEAGFQQLIRLCSNDETIVLLGQSVGGALGIHWLAHSDAGKAHTDVMILDSTFPSYSGMVADVLQRNWLTWLFARPVSWFYSDEYDPEQSVSQLPQQLKVALFHSKDDQIIPFNHGLQLYRALARQLPDTEAMLITRGPHISTFNGDQSGNRNRLLAILGEWINEERPPP